MRKIMLAATAITGLGLAASAQAQIASAPVNSTFFNANVSFTPATDGHAAPPAAGTVAPYVNAKVITGIAAGSDSGSNGAGNNGTKINSTNIFTAARLYFGFDGKTASGVEYGALVEVRQFYDSQYGPGGASLAAQMRRERVYIGTPTAGRLLMGVTDGPLGTLLTGDVSGSNFDGFGGWQGDEVQARTTATALSYPITSQSGEYMTNKIVYQSPRIAGFDFGLSYEPTFDAGEGYCKVGPGTGNCYNAASVGNNGVSLSTAGLLVSKQPTYTSTTLGAAGNRINTLEAAVRYNADLGMAKVKVELGTWQSGVVKNATNSTSATQGLNALDGGVSVTVGNLTVGGHYLGGNITNGDQPKAKGTKNSTFLAGEAYYTIGSVMFGAGVMNWQSNPSTAYGQLHEIGYTVGGSYDFAPGAMAFVSAIYGTRHANSNNLLTGATGTAAGSNLHNTVQARAVTTGFVFNF
jgi:outer membrane protein OmpU